MNEVRYMRYDWSPSVKELVFQFNDSLSELLTTETGFNAVGVLYVGSDDLVFLTDGALVLRETDE